MVDDMLKFNAEIKWKEDEERRLTISVSACQDTTQKSQYDNNNKKEALAISGGTMSSPDHIPEITRATTIT